MKEIVFSKGEVVFREGELGDSFYQIVEGTAGVYYHYGEADEKKLTDMKAGEYFGEMAVIESWPRSSTILAEEDLRVYELKVNDLNGYFKKEPDKIIALMKQLGKRIREMTNDYNEVSEFLHNRKAAGKNKESFLEKIRKYREISVRGKQLAESTAEEEIAQKQQAGKAALPVTTYSKGKIIFREGDEGIHMYQIQGGSVGIYEKYGTDQQNRLTTLYTNAFFGEMGMIDNEKRSATAVVEEDGTMLKCIAAGDMQALFEKNPLEADMILSHLSKRLRRLTLDYVNACTKAAEEA